MGNAAPQSVKYSLAPGVGFYARDPGAIQFGLDATRSGVAEVPDAVFLAEVLRSVVWPTPAAGLLEAMTFAGLTPAVARSLVDDLVSFGILHSSHNSQQVAMVGRGPLSEVIGTLLAERGYVVRGPLTGEPVGDYFGKIPASCPVIGIDQLPAAKELAGALATRKFTWIPVSRLDSRGIIGPLVLAGDGPCPLCVDLHRTQVDPRWHHVIGQLPKTQPIGDPAVYYATAAHLGVILDQLCARPSPPGSPPARIMPGEVWDVDIFGKPQRRIMLAHPNCPVCF